MTWSGRTPDEHDPRPWWRGGADADQGKGRRMRKGLRSTGVAVGVLGLLLGTTAGVTAVPGPELEYEWEVGTAGTVYDGDTLDVKIATSNSGYTGTQRVRTIGVQAPEVEHTGQQAQCGSAQAKAALKALAPTGTPDPTARPQGNLVRRLLGRPDRSLHLRPGRGGQLVRHRATAGQRRNGPVVPAVRHDPTRSPSGRTTSSTGSWPRTPRSQSRGLWTPNYCGPSPAANLRMPSRGTRTAL